MTLQDPNIFLRSCKCNIFQWSQLGKSFLRSSLENMKQKLPGTWMILQESLIRMMLHGMIANIQAGEVREV